MKLVKTLIIILSVSATVLFFQNCTVNQNTGLLGAKESASSVLSKTITGAPFAFDMAIDTISYNSCVGNELNNSGIHGIKLGANEGFVDNQGKGSVKAGLKLRTDFLKYVGENIKPRYPSTVITPAQIKEVLAGSTANAGTYLQFAVRKSGDLSVVLDVIQPNANSRFTYRRDGINFFPLLEENLVQALAKNVQFNDKGMVLSEGPRVYNLTEASTATPIEFSFGFSNYTDETYLPSSQNGDLENFAIGERYSEVVRNRFNLGTADKHLLTVTYGTTDGDTTSNGLNTPKRKVETDKAKAYGRAFALNFGYPVSGSAQGWKNNALKNVTEMNLEGGIVSGASWNCSSYLIMRQNEWNSGKISQASCAPLKQTDLENPVLAEKVRALRRHYLEKQWNIGLFYDKNAVYDPNPVERLKHPLCLVPKEAECYLPTFNNAIPGVDIGVNYNPLTECYLYNPYGVTYVNPISEVKKGGRCAQFASICVRTSSNY